MQIIGATSLLKDVALVFGLGFAVVGLLIGLSVSAAILKMACRTAGVEAPDTGRAMIISFLESIVGCVVYMASTLTIGVAGSAANLDRSMIGAAVGLSAVGVTLVVPAGLYVPMLRVKFSKGLVISILRNLITLSIVAAIVVGFLLVSGKVKLHNPWRHAHGFAAGYPPAVQWPAIRSPPGEMCRPVGQRR